jgi:2-polyprenyl-6-hydroxyphenyl methylase/3-demethylubiquinone-9 3-methyltransferase
MSTNANVDSSEIDHFDRIGTAWWAPDGEFRTLHDINPARVAFIAQKVRLDGARVVDVGCGGGILAEGLARQGASVLGIDMSEAAVDAAHQHASLRAAQEELGGRCRYRRTTAEALAAEGTQYDVVTCLEMLEHVPEPAAVVEACARLCRPGGRIFFSTINRTPKAWALAVVGAEYVLGLLPRGTHDYAKFIRPSELDAAARDAGLDLDELRGMHYDPVSRRATLVDDVSVNYLACYAKTPAAGDEA